MMRSHFTTEFFKKNRMELRKRLSTDSTIILPGAGMLERNGGGDQYPFNQESNFWYLTGLNEPDLLLAMSASDEYLLIPNKDDVSIAFNGATDVPALSQQSGIETVMPWKDGWVRLIAELGGTKTAYMPAADPIYHERYELYSSPVTRYLTGKLKRQVPGLKLQDVRPTLALMRCIKQEEELQAIQEAIDITSNALNYVRQPEVLEKFRFEYQLEAALSLGFRSSGATGHSFVPVVASGRRACTLHYNANNEPLERGELTVVDVGAEVEHYAADVSRTIIIGVPTDRQQAVYRAVLEAQAHAFTLLKPGVSYIDYEKEMERFIGDKLLELKVIQKAERTQIRRYFPHATSHFLGLNAHDVGDYRIPIEPGMVFAVEPGIYIPDEGIGVRIEDDVLITDIGIKVLSDSCVRTLR